MTIVDIHDELFEFLIKKNMEQEDLFFRPRKTNRSNKLTDGYWFLGNDDYLTVGFWKGVNWITKAPNIAFMISSTGESWVHVNTSDSEKKTSFVEMYLKKQLGLSPSSPSYIKKFEGKNWKKNLEEFLSFDWYIIDTAIKDYYLRNNFDDKLPIGLIDLYEFEDDIEKINYYRNDKKSFDVKFSNIAPSKIQSFQISNYGPIDCCNLKDIPVNTQWIFLTGENGVGKTSILKALATSIGHRKMNEIESKENKKFKVELNLTGKTKDNIEVIRKDNIGTSKRKPYTVGFAAYGPMRLQTLYGALSPNQLKNAKSKSGTFRSLFNNDGYLLDLESEFQNWKDKGIDISKRENEIKELLESIMLNIREVGFTYRSGKTPITLFSEIDSNGELLHSVTIDKLSSGYLSIVAMMSDMIVRLYQQQPEIYDIADLRGVVLIDEIDIHLHPKFQKHFVEQLTEAFPNVQFIVTTHSAIPLLGAPENSVFCVITRNASDGVKIARLKKLENEIKYLTPNTILTSDIFDFDFFEDMSDEAFEKLYIEDNYDEVKWNKEVDQRLRKLDTDIFPQDLFKE
ncbi:AAA family ATPase [Flavobacterium sp. GA093]|uniref:AAA family ATPase n=1 Tax=Flavobacterium hydrocarbonoxydans TaxID=2683249 RepID=A0A6I4NNS1_9FLAO|nr:AAA family ATPase [Flavobacterium hydrocarbonoxydans]MWB92737.1 AAA family ATPase [Flavobacterium hydrocarbonoxydans]